MPFLKLRGIPRAAKEALKRKTPNTTLLKSLQSIDLTFPLNEEFVRQVENKIPIADNLSGFHPPMGGTESLPFHVERTKTGSLPVYSDYKNGRTKSLTIVRKIQGDKQLLQAELTRITQQPVEMRAGTLQLHGNHQRMVRLYLRALGF